MADFQGLPAFNQDAVTGPDPGSHHDGGGCGKPQRTGAGNHEDSHEYGKHKGQVPSSHCPPQKGCCQGNDHDSRHKIPGNRVGQFGYGGFPALGILYHADDFRQCGVAAHMGDLHLHCAVIIHAAPNHTVPCLFFHRNALACQHGFIHGAASLYQDPVQGNPAARLDQYMLSRFHQPCFHLPLNTIFIKKGCVGRKFHQLADGL